MCRITGQERRAKKKELGLLRRYLRNFWGCWQLNDDMYRCYGQDNPMSRDEAWKIFEKSARDAFLLEAELDEEATE